jgi:magnesium transporter
MKLEVTRCHQDGSVRCGGRELLAEALPDGGWLWVDVEGQDRDTEAWLLAQGFHPLAVEDTLTLQHQPKVEEYGDALFTIVRGIDFNKQDEELGTLKLAAFLETRRLVTVHRAPMRSVDGVRQKIASSAKAPLGGPCHLLYLICDQLVDLYFPIVEETAEEIEELEEKIFDLPEPAHLQRILALRRRLATLRRVMLPHRQVFSHLANSGSGQVPQIDAQAALYFRDIYDNVFRLADAIDLQRDALANSKDTYLSVVSQRTNDIMKVLTLFSAILLPLTFIAGVYGMNFDNMPELHSRYGYFATLTTMIVVAVGLLTWFRRKRWL